MTQIEVTPTEFNLSLELIEDGLGQLVAVMNLIAIAAEHDPAQAKPHIGPALALAYDPVILMQRQLDCLRAFVVHATRDRAECEVAEATESPAPQSPEQRIIDLIKKTVPAPAAPRSQGFVSQAIEEAAVRNRMEEGASDAPEPVPSPADLRDRLIAEQHRAGVDAAIIAQAMNLRRSAVERVVSQLTAGDADQPEATSHAVNS